MVERGPKRTSETLKLRAKQPYLGTEKDTDIKA